ncbi:MAG: DUF1549 domain-containing protein [Planctomycetales bacterium]
MLEKLLRPVSSFAAAVVVCGMLAGTAHAETPLREVIDAEVAKVWKEKGINPSAPAPDAEFLRRVYLDLLGTTPSYQETAAFLDDAAPDKRAKLIDKLLDDPRFAEHQTREWDMVLFGRNPPGYDSGSREGFIRFLREQFAKNAPYDQIVKTILLAEGDTSNQGAPMFLMQYQRNPEDAAVAVTKIFMGVQLECARCHDHPFEDYTQVDFYGMAAFFARLQRVEAGTNGKEKMLALGEKSTGDVLFTGPAIDATPGKKGEPIAPKFLKGEPLAEPELPQDFKEPPNIPGGKMPEKPQFSRKDAFAEWVARPDNPWFAREAANRIFGQFLGKGVVHPVDNLSDVNPPSHPALLDALEKEFVAHRFDIKWYVRELLNSKTYQLSSAGSATEAFPLYYERAKYRPLSAEELAASWRVATGYDEALAKSGKKPENADDFAPLTRGYMLSFFGKPGDGEGNFQGGMHEHLYLNNGELARLFANSGDGTLLHYLSKSEDPIEKKVERLFLQMLSRPPSEEEAKFFVAYLSETEPSGQRQQNAIWTLMTCSEFRFNH